MGSGIFYPGASGDDGGVFDKYSSINSTNAQIDVGLYSGYSRHAWVRFPNVNIPQGATITQAYLTFTTAESSWGMGNCDINIYLNNIDDAVVPASHAGFGALALTSVVAWAAIPEWVLDSSYNSVSIASIVQAVVDRAGWSSGNALMAVIKSNELDDYVFRAFYAHDGSGSKLELHVTWSSGNTVITDLSSEITTKARVIVDLNTDIHAICDNFKDLITDIEVIRCAYWLKTEIKVGCAARWYYTTEWNPNRSLKTSIEAKKPYSFSFNTQTGLDYAMSDPEIEILVADSIFPMRTLFLDYIKVGTANEYLLNLWWARGIYGQNPLRNAKIKAEYVDTQYSNGYEIITCDWLSLKIGEGEYQTLNETPVNLGDMPCDSMLDITLKANCRDCSLTRGIAFFKLSISGDYSEAIYGGPAIYRDGKLYHSSLHDDYQSPDFICRSYIVE